MIGWWTPGPVSRPVRLAIERLATAGDVARVAVMPDVHLAEEVCVGLAVATHDRIYPAAIGGDVGCGVDALPLGAEVESLRPVAPRLLRALQRAIPAERGVGGLLDLPWSDERLSRLAEREGRVQLGTLGSGNHFLELAGDDADELWLLVHSGSRCLGPALQRLHLERATLDPSGLRFVQAEARAPLLADLDSAERWAAANRAELRRRALEALGEHLTLRPGRLTTCCHNHVRQEGGLWVHRKGAIPAGEGVEGVIPGSMGAPSYLVEGRGLAEALWSSSHGAGRQLSRSDACDRFRPRDLAAQMRGVCYDEARARQLVDEAPGAYKDIGQVMRAQRELTRITSRLRPLLNHKGR